MTPPYPKPVRRRRTIGQTSKAQVEKNRPGVYQRDDFTCVVANSLWARLNPCNGTLTIQHAIGRGNGGSALYDGAECLRAMCSAHNDLQPANAYFGAECIWFGWSIERNRRNHDPTQIPVRYPDGRDYLLTPDFQKALLSVDEAAELRALIHGTRKIGETDHG